MTGQGSTQEIKVLLLFKQLDLDEDPILSIIELGWGKGRCLKETILLCLIKQEAIYYCLTCCLET